ncbi:MAG TPA: anti-sigma factor [Gaiella sp.]|nr:anti-sigma factor [Gaiella sp.]
MRKATPARLVPVDGPDDDVEAVEASLGARAPLPALELPRPRRPSWPTLAALAIASAVLAVAFGAWAVVAEFRSDPAAGDVPAGDAVGVLADSSSERFELHGSVGRIALVVGDGDRAVLTLDGLGPAPNGRTYVAWVVPPGSAVPARAGTFDGTERVVPLSHRIRPGARVAVTLEPSGDASRPSRPLHLVAVRD